MKTLKVLMAVFALGFSSLMLAQTAAPSAAPTTTAVPAAGATVHHVKAKVHKHKKHHKKKHKKHQESIEQ